MIANNNYFNQIDRIDFSTLPDAFKKGHEFLVKATSNGESWTSYQFSDTVKKTIDIYLAKLNELSTITSRQRKNSRKNSRKNKRISKPVKKL